MKFLLVFAVLFIAIYIWRRNRREELNERAPRPQAPPAVDAPQQMTRCAHCGLHLPASDAIAGPGGVYCSAAHRQAGPT
jgi:uncharacterized protein